MTYRIRIKENLSDHWRGYFGDLSIRDVQSGDLTQSELSGELDESALHGVLGKLRDLNLHLVSVDTLEDSS